MITRRTPGRPATPAVLHLLLGREPAHVPDDEFAAGRHLSTPVLAAPIGRETLGVDAAPPEPHAVDADRRETFEGRRRRCERERRTAVQPAQMPGQRLCAPGTP